MAAPLDNIHNKPEPLDIEKVQQVFELNQTLDDMVMMVVGMVTRAIEPLPSGFAKNAFMNKLQKAFATLAEEVKKGK